MAEYNLERFVDAQQRDYQNALSEIKNGRKRSHWMWYVFPQIQGLGFTEMSRFYAIKDINEATAYLQHPVLGKRLTEISKVLLTLKNTDATSVFGNPDDLKLRSSMTLFAAVKESDPVFQAVLDKFFKGVKDARSLEILNNR